MGSLYRTDYSNRPTHHRTKDWNASGSTSRPDVSIADPEGAPPQASAGVEVAVDPLEAKKAAEEAEEQRLAEVRRLGTPVTPATFAPWKQRFYAALAAAAERKRCALRRFAFTYA